MGRASRCRQPLSYRASSAGQPQRPHTACQMRSGLGRECEAMQLPAMTASWAWRRSALGHCSVSSCSNDPVRLLTLTSTRNTSEKGAPAPIVKARLSVAGHSRFVRSRPVSGVPINSIPAAPLALRRRAGRRGPFGQAPYAPPAVSSDADLLPARSVVSWLIALVRQAGRLSELA
jgi:hypothetical protein